MRSHVGPSPAAHARSRARLLAYRSRHSLKSYSRSMMLSVVSALNMSPNFLDQTNLLGPLELHPQVLRKSFPVTRLSLPPGLPIHSPDLQGMPSDPSSPPAPDHAAHVEPGFLFATRLVSALSDSPSVSSRLHAPAFQGEYRRRDVFPLPFPTAADALSCGSP